MIVMFILYLVGLTSASATHNFFYRRDYTYVEEFDAFFKIHWDPKVHSWTEAFKTCDDEGAKLFYPKEDLEWTVVKKLSDTLPAKLNTTNVIVGIRDLYGFGEFVNIDGQSASIEFNKGGQYDSGPCCIYMIIDTGLFEADYCTLEPSYSLPFVCKKVDETPCPTIDLDYVYNKGLRKCYKVHYNAKTWKESYHTCYQEGAMLAVVDNESEANHIKEVIDSNYHYHTGFSKIDGDYYTVTGKRLEKVYRQWMDNNHVAECGAVMRFSSLLYTKTVQCSETLPFICEMQAK